MTIALPSTSWRHAPLEVRLPLTEIRLIARRTKLAQPILADQRLAVAGQRRIRSNPSLASSGRLFQRTGPQTEIAFALRRITENSAQFRPIIACCVCDVCLFHCTQDVGDGGCVVGNTSFESESGDVIGCSLASSRDGDDCIAADESLEFALAEFDGVLIDSVVVKNIIPFIVERLRSGLRSEIASSGAEEACSCVDETCRDAIFSVGGVVCGLDRCEVDELGYLGSS